MAGRNGVGKPSRLGGQKLITERERKVVEGVAAGRSDRQAALDAGYSDQMSRNTMNKLWSKARAPECFRVVTCRKQWCARSAR